MCQFIESICCIDGVALNLKIHQERVNRTFSTHMKEKAVNLSQLITNIPKTGKYKCRIEYSNELTSLEYQPYNTRIINSLKLVRNDSLDYSFKFKNRNKLDRLFAQKDNADDIIIVRQGLVTDSYYANLAFYDGNKWFTPTNPLLKGTKRAYYLLNGRLIEKDILGSDVFYYKKVSLINAMLDLSEIEVDISNIQS